jgi:uncharacterized protein (DUF4415 family)
MSAATSPELHDRRQRACEAFADSCHVSYANADTIDEVHAAIDEAIETATRVRIDDAVYEAFVQGTRYSTFRNGLIEAFKAAGFEVEE